MDSRWTLNSSSNGKGHIRWQAPEILNVGRFPDIKGELTTASDIYALACVYLEVFKSCHLLVPAQSEIGIYRRDAFLKHKK